MPIDRLKYWDRDNKFEDYYSKTYDQAKKEAPEKNSARIGLSYIWNSVKAKLNRISHKIHTGKSVNSQQVKRLHTNVEKLLQVANHDQNKIYNVTQINEEIDILQAAVDETKSIIKQLEKAKANKLELATANQDLKLLEIYLRDKRNIKASIPSSLQEKSVVIRQESSKTNLRQFFKPSQSNLPEEEQISQEPDKTEKLSRSQRKIRERASKPTPDEDFNVITPSVAENRRRILELEANQKAALEESRPKEPKPKESRPKESKIEPSIKAATEVAQGEVIGGNGALVPEDISQKALENQGSLTLPGNKSAKVIPLSQRFMRAFQSISEIMDSMLPKTFGMESSESQITKLILSARQSAPAAAPVEFNLQDPNVKKTIIENKGLSFYQSLVMTYGEGKFLLKQGDNPGEFVLTVPETEKNRELERPVSYVFKPVEDESIESHSGDEEPSSLKTEKSVLRPQNEISKDEIRAMHREGREIVRSQRKLTLASLIVGGLIVGAQYLDSSIKTIQAVTPEGVFANLTLADVNAWAHHGEGDLGTLGLNHHVIIIDTRSVTSTTDNTPYGQVKAQFENVYEAYKKKYQDKELQDEFSLIYGGFLDKIDEVVSKRNELVFDDTGSNSDFVYKNPPNYESVDDLPLVKTMQELTAQFKRELHSAVLERKAKIEQDKSEAMLEDIPEGLGSLGLSLIKIAGVISLIAGTTVFLSKRELLSESERIPPATAAIIPQLTPKEIKRDNASLDREVKSDSPKMKDAEPAVQTYFAIEPDQLDSTFRFREDFASHLAVGGNPDSYVKKAYNDIANAVYDEINRYDKMRPDNSTQQADEISRIFSAHQERFKEQLKTPERQEAWDDLSMHLRDRLEDETDQRPQVWSDCIWVCMHHWKEIFDIKDTGGSSSSSSSSSGSDSSSSTSK